MVGGSPAREVITMVTYSDLITFVSVIINVITLVCYIHYNNK